MPAPIGPIERLRRTLATRVPETVVDSTRRLAAVAAVFAENPASLLLIRRAERVGDKWSGQMALPGGRWSPGDDDLLTTARRETLEEVGVDLSGGDVLGALDDVAPRTPTLPPIIVRPFVFRIDRPEPLQPNHEVALAAWVELGRLTDDAIYRDYHYRADGASLLLPGYHLPEGVVWGMTERILTPLLAMLR